MNSEISRRKDMLKWIISNFFSDSSQVGKPHSVLFRKKPNQNKTHHAQFWLKKMSRNWNFISEFPLFYTDEDDA